jgi:C-terminal processing protease CtpA/Prc
VTVKLPGHPTRVGISWREDTAQPGSVMVTRLVPGSAAALAGLRAGDRVYQFDGHDFADTEQFAQRLRQASGPITLEIERHGQLETLSLDLSPAN